MNLESPAAARPIEAPHAQGLALGSSQPILDLTPQNWLLGTVSEPLARDHEQARGALEPSGVQGLGQAA